MSDYDDNPCIERMARHAETPDAWSSYKEHFAKLGPNQRVQQLEQVDQWLELQAKPNRQTASFLQMKRELSDVHWLLRKADR
jgi:hypothetical protein